MPPWRSKLAGAGWRWVLLTALLLALHLTVWPLVWRWVIIPNAEGGAEGLRAEVRLADQPRGPARALLVGPQDLRLEQAGASAQALAVWWVERTGFHDLRVQADDHASLSLDRRVIIQQAREVSSLNQAEARVWLDAGPHFLQVTLNNLEGQGWLRLYLRPPGQEQWQDLPRRQLHPPDLGNLDFWLGLVAWLEGLTLWGLWGALLGLGMLLARDLAGERISPQTMARAWRGLLAGMLSLPSMVALARRWPARVELPWLAAYGPDLRFEALGLMVYALAIGVVLYCVLDNWRRRLGWGLLLLGLVAVRVYAWPYSIHDGIHPDWTSFTGFYIKFEDLYLGHHLERRLDLGSLLAYLADVARNLYVGYPSGCFSFPAFLMGVGAMAARVALEGSGARLDFFALGHLLGPAFNLAYALLLALFFRRHLAPGASAAWSWWLVLLLALLPTHIYLGANITYNLLADALHLALLMAGLWMIGGWRQLISVTAPQSLGARLIIKNLWPRGLLLGVLLGLCLATKIVFIPALVTLLVYTGALCWRHRRLRPALAWLSLPGSLLASLGLGGVIYGLIIIRNVLNVPGFWGQLLGMTGDNTSLSLAKLGLGPCLRIFFGDLLLPNLGYVGTVAGGLGLALLGWRAWCERDLARGMIFLWALLTAGLNLLSWSMLLMFNAMPRSSMLLGLWLALGLYLVKEVWDWLFPGLARRASQWLRGILVGALGLELALAGLSLLVMYGAGAPRHQCEVFLGGLAGTGKSVAAVMYLTYGDDPNTVLGRAVAFHDARTRLRTLSDQTLRHQIISQANADYWLLTSYEAYFLTRGQADAQDLRRDLEAAGYRATRRFASRPLAAHPWLEGPYQHFVGPLMAGPRGGGLQEPSYIEVYARGDGQD